VKAIPEAEVRVGVTCEVEAVRLGEVFGVAIGGSLHEVDELADCLTITLGSSWLAISRAGGPTCSAALSRTSRCADPAGGRIIATSGVR
jgi:hypothetical protein